KRKNGAGICKRRLWFSGSGSLMAQGLCLTSVAHRLFPSLGLFPLRPYNQLLPVAPMVFLSAFLFFSQSGVSRYWHKLTDRTFTGVYHANAFDLAMMIPYFIILIILAGYGLHRYWLGYDYYKYRKNVPGPPPHPQERAPVPAQIPTFNQRDV